jgi:hypothetical protein
MDLLFKSRSASKSIRRTLSAKYALKEDRRYVVCAVPQYLEHGLLDAPDHWRLTEQMLASLERTGANVLLSLHPLSQREDYLAVAKRFGAVVVTQPLLEFLPAADLFVATHSSTVRWAILLRIPVIVLDDFDVGVDAMYGGGGVQLVRDRSELEPCARQLVENSSRRASVQEALERQAHGMDPFDGGNSARVIALLRSQLGFSVLGHQEQQDRSCIMSR